MIDSEEMVVLVNEQDETIGTMDKLQAHREGTLHRAFSIFVFNDNNELMLQRRAYHKYHSGGLWTNTCCSHPRPGEGLESAVHRRLIEEMGFDCDLTKAFSFVYEKKLDNELTEHELDHVFIGRYNGEPNINQDEVAEWKYQDLNSLLADIDQDPDQYTAWFNLSIGRVADAV